MLNIAAKIMFESGPAIPTQSISLRGFLNAEKFTGTGLAYPKRNLPPVEKNNNKGRTTVPIGSMCAKGLSVNLPEYLAVGSPNLYAAHPCENS